MPASLLTLLLVALAPAPLQVAAQDPQPTTQPATSLPAGMPYTDYNYGFKLILPPANVFEYDRTRFHEWKGSVGVLRGRSFSGKHSLQIVIFRDYEMPPFNDWIERFRGDLKQGTGTQSVDIRPLPVSDRMAVVIEQRAQLGASIILTQYLCVPFDQNTVWVFAYSGVADDQPGLNFLKDSFNQITSTLEVLYNPDDAGKLSAALERGVDIRKRILAGAISPKIDSKERFFEIALAGKPIGYLRRQLVKEEHDFGKTGANKKTRRKGIRLRELAWRFAEDGTVRRTKLDAFTTDDLKSELIENQIVQLPPPGVSPRVLQVRTDSVVREDFALVSSFSTNMDTKYRDPQPPMGVGPAYLDWTYLRLLPAILLPEPKQTYAFVTYDSEKRALITYSITLVEESKIDMGGKAVAVVSYEIREGFAEQSTRIDVDKTGAILRIQSGDLIISRSTSEQVEKLFGAQRATAELIIDPKPATPEKPKDAPKKPADPKKKKK